MNVAKLDKDGKVIKGQFETFSIVGSVRKLGKSDEIVNEICIKRKIMRNSFKNTKKGGKKVQKKTVDVKSAVKKPVVEKKN